VGTIEIKSDNATVIIAYDDTYTSILHVQAIVYKLKFKLEVISYLT